MFNKRIRRMTCNQSSDGCLKMMPLLLSWCGSELLVSQQLNVRLFYAYPLMKVLLIIVWIYKLFINILLLLWLLLWLWLLCALFQYVNFKCWGCNVKITCFDTWPIWHNESLYHENYILCTFNLLQHEAVFKTTCLDMDVYCKYNLWRQFADIDYKLWHCCWSC